jgi:hypothetical protein
MTSGDFKITRIKAANQAAMNLMGDVLKVAHEKLPELAADQRATVEFRHMSEELSTLGKYARTGGFDPTRQFQHVARFSQPVWQLIIDMFGRFDDNGTLMDDGLLYKEIEGRVQLYKPGFFAIVDFLESSGIECDMRGKIKLN